MHVKEWIISLVVGVVPAGERCELPIGQLFSSCHKHLIKAKVLEITTMVTITTSMDKTVAKLGYYGITFSKGYTKI